MNGYEWLGAALVITAAAMTSGFVATSRMDKEVKALLVWGIVMHIVGAMARYWVFYEFYDAGGDAGVYYSIAVGYAERFADLDFRMFFDPSDWWVGQWRGSEFLAWIVSFVVLLVGPSPMGVFISMALLSFIGPVVLGLRVRKLYPHLNTKRYLALMWLWPSLWFWPSGIGKESMMMLGICLAVTGYLGNGKRMQWTLLIPSVVLVYSIRSQVAAVLVTSIALARWLSLQRGEWTPAKVVQGIGISMLGVAFVIFAMQTAGLESVEDVTGYLGEKAANSGRGGSGVIVPTTGIAGIPVAFMNVWFRPFLWEAHNVLALLSAIEVAGLWGIVWYYRRSVVQAVRLWRKNALVQFAIPFLLLYSIPFGMAVANLGIVARQRVFLFPFLFVLAVWDVYLSQEEARRRTRPYQQQYSAA